MGNIAYIDGQNLNQATTKADIPWKVDFGRFRAYLKRKYGVDTALYFMGVHNPKYEGMYNMMRRSGFEVVFREHSKRHKSDKAGNVDSDVVFSMMRDMHEDAEPRLVLVSGDGDYIKTVRYLVDNDRMEKVLFPSHRNASSLYKEIPTRCKAYLDDSVVRRKIELAAGGLP